LEQLEPQPPELPLFWLLTEPPLLDGFPLEMLPPLGLLTLLEGGLPDLLVAGLLILDPLLEGWLFFDPLERDPLL
jgi:hypothetical protein